MQVSSLPLLKIVSTIEKVKRYPRNFSHRNREIKFPPGQLRTCFFSGALPSVAGWILLFFILLDRKKSITYICCLRKEVAVNKLPALKALSVIMLLSVSAFSQVSFRPGLVIGLGMFKETISNPSDSFTTNNRAGFLAGGVLDIAFNKYLSVQPGVEYSGRGGSATSLDNFTGDYLTSIDKLNYLAIPIDLRVKYPVTPFFSSYILGGANLGILLSATNSGTEPGISTYADIKNGINSMDFGFDLGAGAEFYAGAVIPFFEVSYMLGIADVAANESSGYSQYNHGLEIKAGVKFKT
jgi:opacity protein-like surface antigen